MKVIAGAMWAGIAGAVLVGCGGVTGEVIDKHYTPSYYTYSTETVYSKTCVKVSQAVRNSKGKVTGTRVVDKCTSRPVGSRQVPHFHGASTVLVIRDSKGKIRTKSVGEQKFYSVEIGQHVEDI